ncbi:MAG: single-stranded DNA-binding protein [Candidatus Woesebacteria bacterium]|nr:MAG: single-stranded DNA-binding protein [Candidatus Woesebacteria bacterium]
MAKSLNRVMLIGNMTRDPEMRYTPQGTAVCTFGIATNSSWTNDAGEKKENVEFHNIVAWNKLAEICAQLLKKGRKVFVEGRLTTRSWQGTDGTQKQRTEVVINDMLILDRKSDEVSGGEIDVPEQGVDLQDASAEVAEKSAKKDKKTPASVEATADKEEVGEEDIPF